MIGYLDKIGSTPIGEVKTSLKLRSRNFVYHSQLVAALEVMNAKEIEIARKRMHKAKMLSVVCVVCVECDEVQDCTCEFGIKLVKQITNQCLKCSGCISSACSMGEVIKQDHLEDQLNYCNNKRGDNFPFILRPEVEPFFCF